MEKGARPLIGAVMLLIAQIVGPGDAIAGPSFQAIGGLPGATSTRAAAVSDDGLTVVGSSGGQAFRWSSSTGAIPLGTLPGDSLSGATAVSADGSVIGGSSRATASANDQPFVWTASGGLVALGHLSGSHDLTYVTDVSADGSTLVGYSCSDECIGQLDAFRWTTSGGMSALGPPPGTGPTEDFTWATAVSGDGSTIGLNLGLGFEEGDLPLLWTEATGSLYVWDVPGSPPGLDDAFSIVTDVSTDGSTLVGYGLNAKTGYFSARWTLETGFVPLPAGKASAVSADGSVIGGATASAWIWTEADGQRDLAQLLVTLGLDLTGWTLQQIVGISADGRTIVGNGLNPLGQTQGFIAIIPEPTTFALVGTGVAMVGSTRARRRRRNAVAREAR